MRAAPDISNSRRIDLVEIEEPCTHETQFGGLCVDCGEDMTKVDYLTKERDVNRATVNLTHDNTALLVSHNEAVRAEEDTKKRLLNSKKLTLIVDLDQTVIHTTQRTPTTRLSRTCRASSWPTTTCRTWPQTGTMSRCALA
jgi:phosphatidate phosphatase APP1